jgi:hypothetical protein
MNGKFASSPTFFDDGVDANWMTETVGKPFPNFQLVEVLDCILCISLVSLIHNQEKVMAFNANHFARSISIFQDLSMVEMGCSTKLRSPKRGIKDCMCQLLCLHIVNNLWI